MTSRPRSRWLWLAALVPGIFVLSVGVRAGWRLRHPAPLGRSQVEVDRSLARALPVGASVAAATAYLDQQGVDYAIDSTRAGGRLRGMTRDVDATLFATENVSIELDFDAEWRLTARRTRRLLTGM